MRSITFECEVITPMFLAGADGKTPELRPPSIKGLMRFWWRAMNGHLPPKKLKKREAEIFGGSGKNEGRSKISIRILPKNILLGRKKQLPEHTILTNYLKRVKQNGQWIKTENKIKINILDYIAYGAMQYNKQERRILMVRGYFDVGTKFDIIAKYDKNNEPDILSSFNCFFKYGNLGSKSRNGFGSLNLLDNNKFYDLNFKLKDLPDDLPPYTAFSKESCLFETKETCTSWDKALAEIGKIYREARLSLESPHNFEERQYISLPLIAKGEKSITDFMKDNRKSKSYFLKVVKIDNSYKGRVLFLPSVYGLKEDNNKSLINYKKMNSEIAKKMNTIEVDL